MKKENKLSKGAEQMIEDLADLEHQQWMYWSKNIVNNEKISEDRMDKWAGLWKPYNKLTEEQKEKDRVWARKVLECQWNSASKELKRRGKWKNERKIYNHN